MGAFCELALELANTGCDTVVLALVTRAASDEVRHRELCRRLASEFLSESLTGQLRGVPTIPPHVGVSAEDKALLHLVEMGCLSETLTGAYLTQMLARAENGWAHLAARAAYGRIALCDAKTLFAETLRDVIPRQQ